MAQYQELQKHSAIPSAYNIISSNRSIGYSLSAAIADIIDNSLSAGASKIELYAPAGPSPVLMITDNGYGMDMDALADAMTFGGRINCDAVRDLNDLGRFGMGLKTASLSQCRRLEVITKQNGKYIGGCWDLDYLKKNDSWEFLVINEEDCKEKVSETMLIKAEVENGTTVIWSKFDRLKESSSDLMTAFDSLMDSSVKKLELIFHRYLKGEEDLPKVEITYNRNKLVPNDPFLSDKTPTIATPVETDINGSKVYMLSHKLMHPDCYSTEELNRLCLGSSLIETQGFYVYRTKRLIDYGTWFGMVPKLEKTKLSRVQIDIPNTLDSEWSLDIKKSHIIPPQVIRRELRNIIERNRENSSKTFRSKKKKDDTLYPYWKPEKVAGKDGGVKYHINKEHPMISSFLGKLPDDLMRNEFKIILSNIAKFFPFSSLELDFQNNEKIINSDREIIDKEMSAELKFLYGNGLSVKEICDQYPGMEDVIVSFFAGGKK